jgi:hypothetical protein
MLLEGVRRISVAVWKLVDGRRLVLNRAWAYLQSSVVGMSSDDEPVSTTMVSWIPDWLPSHYYVYEPLGPDAESAALQRRKDSFAMPIESVLSLLGAEVITVAKVDALLRRVADDLNLVHAAYYADPSVIERVAQFIAKPLIDESNSAT